jgi:hypothetical protein
MSTVETATTRQTAAAQEPSGKEMVRQLRELFAERMVRELRQVFADAPGLGRKVLENALREIRPQVSPAPRSAVESTGRVGSRLGSRCSCSA